MLTRPTELSKQITHCEKSGWYRCQPPDVDKAKHRRKMLVSACSICQPKQQECCVNTILYRQQWSNLVTFIPTHYLPTINTKSIYSPQQKLDRPRVSQTTGLQHLREYTRFIQVSERQHSTHAVSHCEHWMYLSHSAGNACTKHIYATPSVPLNIQNMFPTQSTIIILHYYTIKYSIDNTEYTINLLQTKKLDIFSYITEYVSWTTATSTHSKGWEAFLKTWQTIQT